MEDTQEQALGGYKLVLFQIMSGELSQSRAYRAALPAVTVDLMGEKELIETGCLAPSSGLFIDLGKLIDCHHQKRVGRRNFS